MGVLSMNTNTPAKNGYLAFFNGKEREIYANSLYEAKQEAIRQFKPKASQRHMVHVYLVEKDGHQILTQVS